MPNIQLAFSLYLHTGHSYEEVMGQFRANGTVMNQPGFYEAFGVKEGDKMYMPPQERVTI